MDWTRVLLEQRKSSHTMLPQSSYASAALFDHKYYSDHHGVDPDGKLSEAARFEHWKSIGRFQGLDPHPLFSVNYYSADQNPNEFDSVDQITHFLKRSVLAYASPHPAFDSRWYLTNYPDVRTAGTNPLVHYILYGYKEGRKPSPTFDGGWYLRHYADVRESGMNPLIHYVVFGQAEGRYKSQDDFEISTTSRRGVSKPRASLTGSLFRETDSNEKHIAFLPSAGPALRFIPQQMASTKILSLDIWDTLLFRRCHPDDVKMASARLLFVVYRLSLRIAYRDVTSLYRARRVAEDGCSLTTDFEYRFEDAALGWVETVFESGTPRHRLESIVSELSEYEFKLECQCSYLNTAINDFLALEQHPPVVLLSDFYMPSSFLTRLLQVKGFEHVYLKLYSSSDYAENKRSGMLFKRMLNDFQIAPSEAIHVGDNKISDVVAAERQGLISFHYLSPIHELQRESANRMFSARLAFDSLPHNRSLVKQLAGASLAKYGHTPDGVLSRLGFNVAPLAVGFILHIIERAKLFGLDRIYFFTREGAFFKQLYELVTSLDPYGCSYPQAFLLDVSRIATFAPSLQNWDETELMRLWSLYGTQSPAAFLSTLNLKGAETYFETAGVDFESPIEYPWLNQAFLRIIKSKEFSEFARDSITQQRSLLRDYLSQSGFDTTARINLVIDVGWRGSIQDNISRICTAHLHGCYLGLFKYLNAQPHNCSKSAWLFDLNENEVRFKDIEVAPIEMLFNSLGGSVTGYSRNSQGEITALRDKSDAEDRTFLESTQFIQRGILDATPVLVDTLAIRGLIAEQIVPAGWHVFEGLLNAPPPEFAAAFFGLTHNELFGTGKFYSNEVVAHICNAIRELRGAMLHGAVTDCMKAARWSSGLAVLPRISNAISSIGENAVHLPSVLIAPAMVGVAGGAPHPRVGFILPAPIAGSGGHRTIFKIARQFALRGCEVSCYLESDGDGISFAKDMLGNVDVYIFSSWDKTADLDVAFATIAHSASFVANMANAKVKCYLVQDYEALFNPIGERYTAAENSYMFGLEHFTIGNWLAHVLAVQHKAFAIPAGLGIDLNTYATSPKIDRELAICYLYQPDKPRRNSLLGIEAIRLVKQKLPDVKVYVYGSDNVIDFDFEATQLGLINDLSGLSGLYNRCAVGLCISMSNPSRIPFEMMACGAVPVDVYRCNNLFDYRPGTAVLAHQTAKSVAAAIIRLLEDEELLRRRRDCCLEFTKGRSADWEADIVVNSVFRTLAGQAVSSESPRLLYTEAPVIALEDRTPQVAAFCNWQLRLSASTVDGPI